MPIADCILVWPTALIDTGSNVTILKTSEFEHLTSDFKIPVEPLLMLAYRSSIHESTGVSPCAMMFGREINLPIDLVMGRPQKLMTIVDPLVMNHQTSQTPHNHPYIIEKPVKTKQVIPSTLQQPESSLHESIPDDQEIVIKQPLSFDESLVEPSSFGDILTITPEDCEAFIESSPTQANQSILTNPADEYLTKMKTWNSKYTAPCYKSTLYIDEFQVDPLPAPI